MKNEWDRVAPCQDATTTQIEMINHLYESVSINMLASTSDHHNFEGVV